MENKINFDFTEIIDFFNYEFLTLPLYKIILGFLIFFVFIFARKLFSIFIIKILKKLTSKTTTNLDDTVLDILESPLKFTFIILGIAVSTSILDIHNEFISKLVSTLITFTIFWVFYSAIVKLEPFIFSVTEKLGKDLSKEIGMFFIKALKVFVILIGIVAILKEWGIDVTTFIASLGLGGLAFALAAKDTAANLFGGFAILTDKIFKIGDWVKIGSVEGTVEDIGMRTTKIRAFDKGLITVPNGTIANSSVLNFSRRDRRRIKMRVGVTYSTTPSQMQEMLNEIREMLNDHPQIHEDPMFVYFDEFADSSLSIFFYLFTTTSVWEDYLKIREDINLKLMKIVEDNGASMAFPSQSIYFENELNITKQS
jgi:MscS family membrane protein